MKRSVIHRTSLCSLLLTLACGASFAAEKEPVTFYKDVQPILKKHCTICHNDRSVDEPDVSGGLSLSNPDGILNNEKIKSVVVNKPEASSLYTRLTTTDPAKRMPKDDEPLSSEKIEIIKQWISSGLELGKPVVVSNKRTRSKARVFTDLNLATNATPPAEVFGATKPSKLTLVAQVAPLAPVTALDFSDDGQYLAAGCFRRIVVWDLATATAAAVLDQPLGMVHALAFSPDGKSLYFAGGDSGLMGEIKGFSVGDWKETLSFQEADDVVYGLAVSPDGKTLASTSYDRYLRIFEIPSGAMKHSIKAHSDFAYSVSFSKDGKCVVTAGKDTVVKSWNVETGELIRAYNGHNQGVYAALFNADGKEIYSSGHEPQIFKFDSEKGDRPGRQTGHGGVVYQMAWDKDWKRFISGGSDLTVRTWLPGAKAEKTLRGATDVVYSVALGPNEKLAAAGTWDGYVRVWSLATSKVVLSLISSERPDDKPADWLAVTEEGYYSASPTLSDRARWVMSGKVLPYEQVAASLHKPQEVAKILKEEKAAPIEFPAPKPKEVADAGKVEAVDKK